MSYVIKILSEHLRRESEEALFFSQAHRAHADTNRNCQCETYISPHRDAAAEIQAAIVRLTKEE